METKEEIRLDVEELEERIAPGLIGVNPPGQVGQPGKPPPGQIGQPPPGQLGN